jgi:hypothetical protein
MDIYLFRDIVESYNNKGKMFSLLYLLMISFKYYDSRLFPNHQNNTSLLIINILYSILYCKFDLYLYLGYHDVIPFLSFISSKINIFHSLITKSSASSSNNYARLLTIFYGPELFTNLI